MFIISNGLILLFYTVITVTTGVLCYTVNCDSGPSSLFPSHVSKKVMSIPISPCYQGTYHSIVIFGDSWTANGRGPLKETSYEPGDYEGRMTNGPTWIEYLATFMGADLYDYAYSGATANNTLLPRSVPDIKQQIDEFYTKKPNLNNEDTLYIIWTGVNDVHDIYNKTSNQAEQHSLLNAIIDSISLEVNALQPTEQLIIMGLAPIQQLPLFSPPPGYTNALLDLIKTFNDKLQALSQNVNHQATRFIDTHIFFEKYLHSKEEYELIDTAHACVNDFEQCTASQFSYLWWDDWHPTTIAHQLIAADVFHILHNETSILK
ncbi:GDSL-like Lipase/Acylhydrolase-domain-containing protein [Phascolomyces articulosus]|uniref:GDSL-like Lipase/Acylhydrolase-domain-containing protein n=1 Tax=Phascolomyces articulosus TaxID=60185 RepID=A0AAD5P8K3_9FUNG|nr:GDSL-like Lipase/Acylhydrolase-domain-containing protein [Phascolomyces articulosus]